MMMMIVVGVVVIGLTTLLLRLYDGLHLKPNRLRGKLLKQGIKGPKPSFLIGNLAEMRRTSQSQNQNPSHSHSHSHSHSEPAAARVSHEWAHSLFPFFQNWSRQYGPKMLTFTLGNIVVLYLEDHDLVKDISVCTSLDLGKPSYLQKERGPLLGKGILSSNGPLWVYQRKIMSPELYLDKIKGMYGIMIECANALVDRWDSHIHNHNHHHGSPPPPGDHTDSLSADIRIDLDMRNFSADVISKACFGSSYTQGREIFQRLRALQQVMSAKSLLLGVPGLKHIPTKSNREMWRLEKEIRSLILKVADDRKKEMRTTTTPTTRDLLQIIIEGAENGNFSAEDRASFIVDNCKTVYFAGHETTAMSTCWTLLLLAANPEWQRRVREEVLEVCGGGALDSEMVNKMKLLRMVINESLRLYPTVTFMSREALEEMELGKVVIPKGANIWVPVMSLHRDKTIWGEDADEFKPERFAEGVAGACKVPQLYQPFGAGPRICPGLNLAIAEIKIVLSILLTKFSFSVPDTYTHAPVFRLVIEPEHGINLLVKNL